MTILKDMAILKKYDLGDLDKISKDARDGFAFFTVDGDAVRPVALDKMEEKFQNKPIYGYYTRQTTFSLRSLARHEDFPGSILFEFVFTAKIIPDRALVAFIDHFEKREISDRDLSQTFTFDTASVLDSHVNVFLKGVSFDTLKGLKESAFLNSDRKRILCSLFSLWRWVEPTYYLTKTKFLEDSFESLGSLDLWDRNIEIKENLAEIEINKWQWALKWHREYEILEVKTVFDFIKTALTKNEARKIFELLRIRDDIANKTGITTEEAWRIIKDARDAQTAQIYAKQFVARRDVAKDICEESKGDINEIRDWVEKVGGDGSWAKEIWRVAKRFKNEHDGYFNEDIRDIVKEVTDKGADRAEGELEKNLKKQKISRYRAIVLLLIGVALAWVCYQVYVQWASKQIERELSAKKNQGYVIKVVDGKKSAIWHPGHIHEKNPNLIASAEEGKLSCLKPGYIWDGGAKIKWAPNETSPKYPHWITTERQDVWKMEDGYKMADSAGRMLSPLVWDKDWVSGAKRASAWEGVFQHKRKCSKCDGSGQIDSYSDCNACQGSGIKKSSRACTSCNGMGNKISTCQLCSGSGIRKHRCTMGQHCVPCTKCKGHGFVMVGGALLGRREICSVCSGARFVAHAQCDGTGWRSESCFACKGGANTSSCMRCNGTKRMTIESKCPALSCVNGKIRGRKSCDECDGQGSYWK